MDTCHNDKTCPQVADREKGLKIRIVACKYVEEAVTNPVNVSTPAYRLTEGLNFLVNK